jgi:hypothetical protein
MSATKTSRNREARIKKNPKSRVNKNHRMLYRRSSNGSKYISYHKTLLVAKEIVILMDNKHSLIPKWSKNADS